MIEFLPDQGLPRATVQHLQGMGLQSVHVGNLGLAAATDEAILNAGRDRGAIVVTLDSDFHTLLARSKASAPSVIRIRIQGLKGDGVARVIQPMPFLNAATRDRITNRPGLTPQRYRGVDVG